MNFIHFFTSSILISLTAITAFQNIAFADETNSCYKLTDQFCNQLWDKEHNGHIKVFDGEILLGKSNKSRIGSATLLDLKALIQSQSHLPADLRNPAKPLLNKLAQLLQKEEESRAWFREIENFEKNFTQTLQDVSEKRVQKKFPELKKKKLHELNEQDQYLLTQSYYRILDEVTDAKYLNSENWQRIQHVFVQVKKDITQAVEGLDYSTELKKNWVQAIEEVTLSLPYLDPDKLQAHYTCSTNEINAFYNERYKKITVCAGFFNTLQSESASYYVLAHELAHSIDPNSLSEKLWREKGMRNKSLIKLIGNNDKIFSCEEWKKIASELPKIPVPTQLPQYEYDKLMTCLDDSKPLKKPYDSNEIFKIAERNAIQNMNHYANYNSFVLLFQPTYNEEGIEKENKRFLNTELILSHTNAQRPMSTVGRNYADVPEIFYQDLFCENNTELKDRSDLIQFIKSGNQKEKQETFKKSLKKTSQIVNWLYEENMLYCGQYCYGLVSYGMSRNITEKFADWLAFKTLNLFLSRKKDIQEQQLASAVSTVLFCESPSPQREVPDYIAMEKEYSLEPHPDRRARRYSIYSDENAKLIQCTVPAVNIKWGNCKVN